MQSIIILLPGLKPFNDLPLHLKEKPTVCNLADGGYRTWPCPPPSVPRTHGALSSFRASGPCLLLSELNVADSFSPFVCSLRFSLTTLPKILPPLPTFHHIPLLIFFTELTTTRSVWTFNLTLICLPPWNPGPQQGRPWLSCALRDPGSGSVSHTE